MDAWRRLWDDYKLSLILSNAWTPSGRNPNPEKYFFLRLAAESVVDHQDCKPPPLAEINSQWDIDGLSYARKAMIICGIVRNTNGVWEESQLKSLSHNKLLISTSSVWKTQMILLTSIRKWDYLASHKLMLVTLLLYSHYWRTRIKTGTRCIRKINIW